MTIMNMIRVQRVMESGLSSGEDSDEEESPPVGLGKLLLTPVDGKT